MPSAAFKVAPRTREARKAFSCYGGNFDATVGIIGAGMIGSLVIEMLRPYRVRVMVFDPFLSDKRAGELDVEKVSLPTLFASCTVVSNHLANNAETRGMLNGALFAVMPPNATFINTGRGAQVVEADLIRVLRARRDLIALLDVTAPEPPLDDSELYSLPNCILTPHIAGSSGKEVHRMSEYMYAEFEKLLRGAPTSYEVTEAMLKTMA